MNIPLPFGFELIVSRHKFKMKHLAAYLLLGLAGNSSPSASDIKGVLESVGIDAEEDRLEKLLSELKGKDIQTVRPEWSHELWGYALLILCAVNPRRLL